MTQPIAHFQHLAFSPSSPVGLLKCIAPIPAGLDVDKMDLHTQNGPLPTKARRIDNFGNYEFTAWCSDAPAVVDLRIREMFNAPPPAAALHGIERPDVGLVLDGPEHFAVHGIETADSAGEVHQNLGLTLWASPRWHDEYPILELDLDLSIGDVQNPRGDFLFRSAVLQLPEGWIAVPVLPLRCHRMEGSTWMWAPPLKDGSMHSILQYRGIHTRVVIAPLAFAGLAQSVAAGEGFAIAAHGHCWYTIEGATFDALRQPLPRLKGDLLAAVEKEVSALHKGMIQGIVTGGPVEQMFGMGGSERADGLLRDFNPSYGGATSGLDLGSGNHPERAQPSTARQGLFLSRLEHYWETTSRPLLHLFKNGEPLVPGDVGLPTSNWNTELSGGEQNQAKVHVITDPWGFHQHFNPAATDGASSYAAWARARGGIDEEHGGRFRKDCAFLASCGDRLAAWHLRCRAAMVMLSEPTRYDKTPDIGKGANCGREDAWNLLLICEASRFQETEAVWTYLDNALIWFRLIVINATGHHEARFNNKYGDDLCVGGPHYHMLGQATAVTPPTPGGGGGPLIGTPLVEYAPWYNPQAIQPPYNERPAIAQAWEEVLLSNAFLAIRNATSSHQALYNVIDCARANLWAWDHDAGLPWSHYTVILRPGVAPYERFDQVPVWGKRDHDNWYLPALVANALWAAFLLNEKEARTVAVDLFKLWCGDKTLEEAAGVVNGKTQGIDQRWQMMALSGFFLKEQIIAWGEA